MAKSNIETELRHLRREVRTALELAIVALAPTELVERLATAAGYLEAVSELPQGSAPATALIPALEARSRASLEEWRKWQKTDLEKKIAKG